MDVDRARSDIDVSGPSRLDQFVSCQHFPRILQQMPQQFELDRSEQDFPTLTSHAMRFEIHFDLSVAQ